MNYLNNGAEAPEPQETGAVDSERTLAASDPVPVTETDPNARIMGWIAGKRLAAQRGKA